MGFSRQEYWSGLPCFPPGGLPHPGIGPTFLMSLALLSRFFTTSAIWEALPAQRAGQNAQEGVRTHIRACERPLPPHFPDCPCSAHPGCREIWVRAESWGHRGGRQANDVRASLCSDKLRLQSGSQGTGVKSGGSASLSWRPCTKISKWHTYLCS